MKKRFLSIVLAVLMLLSVLPVTAMAADRTTVNTAQNGIEATKTAKWVNEKEGIAEITITVRASRLRYRHPRSTPFWSLTCPAR